MTDKSPAPSSQLLCSCKRLHPDSGITFTKGCPIHEFVPTGSAPSSSKLETVIYSAPGKETEWIPHSEPKKHAYEMAIEAEEAAEAAPKPAESQLDVYSKLLADTRQFLVDAQLSFVDQIRKIDELIGDIKPTDWWDKVNLDPEVIKERSSEPPIEPFGLDNDHL